MKTGSFVELRLGDLRAGIPLHLVERVLRAAAVSPVPGAGRSCLHGIVDVHGEPVPVYDTRRLFGLPSRDLTVDDRFVLVRGKRSRAIFVADTVAGTVQGAGMQPVASFSAHAAGVRGVTADNEGMLFVQDFERFLSLDLAIPLASDGP